MHASGKRHIFQPELIKGHQKRVSEPVKHEARWHLVENKPEHRRHHECHHFLLLFHGGVLALHFDLREILLNEATKIFEEHEIEQGDAIELIKKLPARQCSKLLFLVLDKNKNESQRRAALGWLSNQIGKDAADREEK